MKFEHRSSEKELLDRNDIPFADIERNMAELEVINSKLGGHRITIEGLKSLLNKFPIEERAKTLVVCEIGCGGGDNLSWILRWAKKCSINIRLIGIDINAQCIEYARKHNDHSAMQFICGDYAETLVQIEKADIIFSSLFCHHFSDEELVQMFSLMKRRAKKGCFINDLHRHAFAYYSIKFLTTWFSKSYLVKNDAPISVLRGFKRKELHRLLTRAGIRGFHLEWKWAFRWLAVF
jgi:2-polyprenyl-3-methyl-5-hydroxy-6-metoxy-1,4-benzoquinol methylase